MMKKTMAWLVLGIVGALALAGLAVAPALAQQASEEEDEDGFVPGRGGMRLVWALDLTADQIVQARALRDEAFEASSDLRGEIRAEMGKLLPRIKDGSLSQNDLADTHKRIHEIVGRIGERRIDSLYEFYQLLTLEQREQFGALLEQYADDDRGLGFGLLGGDGYGYGYGRPGYGRGGFGPGGGFGPRRGWGAR